MPRTLALALLALPLIPAAAHADRIESVSKIDAVSVHPDGAMVTRRVEVNLPKGGSTVVIPGLPAFLQPETLRVTGRSEGKVVLVGQDLSNVATRPASDPVKGEDPLQALRNEVEARQGAVDALVTKQRTILRYADAPSPASAEKNPIDPEALAKMWDTLGTSLSTVNAELVVLRERLRVASARLSEETTRSRPSVQAGPVRQASVTVEAEDAGTVTFELVYPVPQARWGVLYDATLETKGKDGKPSLGIVRRAVVEQGSGEDWTDVLLTIETAMLNRNRQYQRIEPQQVRIVPRDDGIQMEMVRPSVPLSPMPGQPRGVQGGRAPSQAMSGQLARANEERLMRASEQGGPTMPTVEAKPLAPLDRPQIGDGRAIAPSRVASAQTNGASHGFLLPARLTVAGDNTARAVRLGEDRLTPKVRVDVTPRTDPSAYLSAQFTWQGDMPLFPGTVTLFSDGVSVGKAQVPMVSSGEEHTLPFGVDDLVKVERAADKDRTVETGVLINVTLTRTVESRYTIVNRHAGPVDVRVSDRIPFTEEGEIKVERKAVSPEPDTKDAKGLLAWNRTLAPGETLPVAVAYSIAWPKSANVTYVDVPGVPGFRR